MQKKFNPSAPETEAVRAPCDHDHDHGTAQQTALSNAATVDEMHALQRDAPVETSFLQGAEVAVTTSDPETGLESPTPAVTPGGPLVITTEAAWSTQSYVAWFDNQVKEKLAIWNVAYAGGAVSVSADAGGPGVAGIVLTWNPAWGERPVSTELGAGLGPLVAKIALGAVQALPGWATMSAEDQARVAAMIGGETNPISVAARLALEPQFATLAAGSAEDQVTALKALLTDRSARPQLVPDNNERAGDPYTITGPTDHEDYAFAGLRADAEEWSITFEDGQVIPVFAPKAPVAGMQNHTVAQAAEAASVLAPASRKQVTSIVLNPVVNPDDAYWAVEYNNPDFHSYMTAGGEGKITIYPDTGAPPAMEGMKSSMIHETGHTWSYRTWGNDQTQGGWARWQTAMDADGQAVSQYAMNSIAEDVAETVRAYSTTKDTPRGDEYRALLPARFALLDREFH